MLMQMVSYTYLTKDKDTGKEQKITIQASSGLNDDEIEQMVRDAEANAKKEKVPTAWPLV
eukprot:TRINITY_DN1268_c0_g1_i1.p3 TRINITY_DN1268_c0_g1~~TRINITY_DN1268_c0_g1_i1.p3  ORF type:complete len:60 (+),score=26.40 TRINITY_DN1268_c0_g1_i1:538-717(+)